MQPIPVILQVTSRSSKDLTSLIHCAFIHGGLLIHARRECMATPDMAIRCPIKVPGNPMRLLKKMSTGHNPTSSKWILQKETV
jgi:hypothetical protein